MSGDSLSESSLGDADAVARAENGERVLAEAVARNTNSKCNAMDRLDAALQAAQHQSQVSFAEH